MLKKAKRNPVRRRRNPTPMEVAKEVVQVSNLKKAAIMGIGGGAATAFGAAVVGNRLGESKFAPVGVAIVGGIIGAVLLDQVGDRIGSADGMGKFMKDASLPVALGALTLSIWELGRDPTLNFIDTLRVKAGLAPADVVVNVPAPTDAAVAAAAPDATAPDATAPAAGVAGWHQEFSGLGQSYHDEFPRKSAKGVHGMDGVVVPHIPAEVIASLQGYETLGDIYGSQRLGHFESDGLSGLGSFTPEEANIMHQQVYDSARHKAGHYGELGGVETGAVFAPFINS